MFRGLELLQKRYSNSLTPFTWFLCSTHYSTVNTKLTTHPDESWRKVLCASYPEKWRCSATTWGKWEWMGILEPYYFFQSSDIKIRVWLQIVSRFWTSINMLKLFKLRVKPSWAELWRVSEEFLMSSWQVPDKFLTSSWRVPNEFLMSSWQVPDQFPDEFSDEFRTSLHFFSRTHQPLTLNMPNIWTKGNILGRFGWQGGRCLASQLHSLLFHIHLFLIFTYTWFGTTCLNSLKQD